MEITFRTKKSMKINRKQIAALIMALILPALVFIISLLLCKDLLIALGLTMISAGVFSFIIIISAAIYLLKS